MKHHLVNHLSLRQAPFLLLVAAILILSGGQTSSAQCVANPTGETAVGIKNASSHFLTFYIDGVNRGGVPSGDRSVDFVVTPGEHELRAEAVINGEVVSATRTATIPAGYVCTWTVTDPTKAARPIAQAGWDYLGRETLWGIVPIVVPNW